MRGLPVTRATSPDGRWAYTLYDGAGKHPFVHALDTVGARAVCIDLDALEGRRDIDGLRLWRAADDGAALDVLSPRRRPLAHIDTATFAVARRARRGDSAAGDGVLPSRRFGSPLLVLLCARHGLGCCGAVPAAMPSERSRTVKGS